MKSHFQPHRNTFLALAVFSIALLLLTGCNGAGKQIDTATASMSTTRTSLDVGSEQIDRVMESLDALDTTSHLKTGFDRYSKAVDKLDQDAKTARARWASMRARADEYDANWQKEMASIQGVEAREISQKRREAFRNRMAALRDSMESLKAAYQPFVAQLGDIRLILANDLTAGGVRSIASLRAEAAKSAERLRAELVKTRNALAAAETEYSTTIRTTTAEEKNP